MASISNVNLNLIIGGEETFVEVSLTVNATTQEATARQAFREEVYLIGVDEGRGEDGQNDVLGDAISTADVQFNPNFQGYTLTRAKKIPTALLDEDPGIFRADEIRARVTLTPLPPEVVTAYSNTIVRFPVVQPVIEPVT